MKLLHNKDTGWGDAVEEVLWRARKGLAYYTNTSGTTGEPKRIELDLSSALAKKRAGSPDERWLLMYEPFRWAGISVILHTLKSDCTLCLPDEFEFPELLAAFAFYKPTHISCTPSMFRNLVIRDGEKALQSAPIKQITFGGEAANQSVLDLAKSVWPEARISHVYASTELGDICSVSDGLEGVPASKFLSYLFTEDGEMWVGNTSTGDIWERRGDRYYFVGRKNEIINVGGNKVSPIVIEEFALSNGAKVAKAYSIPSPLMGSLVGLDIVGELDTKELLLAYRAKFPKYMCPISINKVDEIEITSAGKLKRR